MVLGLKGESILAGFFQLDTSHIISSDLYFFKVRIKPDQSACANFELIFLVKTMCIECQEGLL